MCEKSTQTEHICKFYFFDYLQFTALSATEERWLSELPCIENVYEYTQKP